MKKKKPGFRLPELSDQGKYVFNLCMQINGLTEVLSAVTNTTGTPAQRANRLLESIDYYNSVNRFSLGSASIEHLLKAFSKIKAQLKLVNQKKLTAKGKQLVSIFNLQDMKLLEESWPVIVKEIENEANELVEKHGLVKPASTPVGLAKQVQKILSGWKVQKITEKYYGDSYLFTSPDELNKLQVSLDKTSSQLVIKPSWRMAATPEKGETWWHDWSRTGVDSGEIYFDGHTHTLNSAIDYCLEKIEKARKAEEEKLLRGQKYEFSPGQMLTLLPEKYENIVKVLKEGKTFEIGPGGFGTYYTFSTTKYSNSSPASKQLSDAVGTTVWYVKSDRD